MHIFSTFKMLQGCYGYSAPRQGQNGTDSLWSLRGLDSVRKNENWTFTGQDTIRNLVYVKQESCVHTPSMANCQA